MSEDDDAGELSTPAELRTRAARYRRMVGTTLDQRVIDALLSLAEEYEALADRMERG